MEFLNILQNNWTIIIFIGGAIWNLSYTYSRIERQNEIVRDLKRKTDTLEKEMEKTTSSHSDIMGDIKEIKAMLNLIINNKIKQ
jgi:septal ring factor EnvC (AmiA/AmiB activator)